MALFGLYSGRFAGGGSAIAFNVALVGGVQMVLEIALLLGFQILEGFVYTQLALIVSCYMTGLALGAAILSARSPERRHPVRSLVLVQIFVALYCLGILELLLILHGRAGPGQPQEIPTAWIISGSALVAGLLGGLHYTAAVQALPFACSRTPDTIGVRLYACDTAGAAAGALVGSLFLLPVYGLPGTLRTLSILTFAGLVAFFFPSRRKFTP